MDMLLTLVQEMVEYTEQVDKYILKQMIFFILRAQQQIKQLLLMQEV
jgi:hypothetical protein